MFTYNLTVYTNALTRIKSFSRRTFTYHYAGFMLHTTPHSGHSSTQLAVHVPGRLVNGELNFVLQQRRCGSYAGKCAPCMVICCGMNLLLPNTGIRPLVVEGRPSVITTAARTNCVVGHRVAIQSNRDGETTVVPVNTEGFVQSTHMRIRASYEKS